MARVSFTELHQNIDRDPDDCEALLVMRQGDKGYVVILAEEEFARWQETIAEQKKTRPNFWVPFDNSTLAVGKFTN